MSYVEDPGIIEPNSPEVKDILYNCYGDIKYFSSTIFPDRFYNPFSEMSKLIFNILDRDDIQKAAIAAPRGWGKTSTVNFSFPASNILLRKKKFIVPISNTATQAVMQSENLKNELLNNVMVKSVFGNMKSDRFSQESWITSSGTMVLPRGSGQQVRGILYGNERPDLIIGDDMEDAEEVKSEEQRAKKKEWFFADVCNSINRSRKDWKIVVVGTILHEDSLLQNLLDDPDWYSVRLELCDDNYVSNWPDYMDDEEVKKLAESYAARGQLDVFYREYRNMPISTEDATFRQDYFKYYEESDLAISDARIENMVIVDPAKTVKLHSAESAVIGIGVDTVANKIYIRDLVAQKLYPDQLYEAIFAMCLKLNARVLGVEVTSLNEFITYPIKNEMIKRRMMGLEFVELKARDKKEKRIAQMVPFYRMGNVYHNRACCGPLEAQLLSFPRSARFDCMDAEAYFVPMLESGLRYFDPTDEEMENEFLDLEDEDYDEPPMQDWRVA